MDLSCLAYKRLPIKKRYFAQHATPAAAGAPAALVPQEPLLRPIASLSVDEVSPEDLLFGGRSDVASSSLKQFGQSLAS